MNPDWHDLIQRHLDGLTTEEEAALLQESLIRFDAVARLYLRYMNLDVALEAHASSSASMKELLVSPDQGETRRWTHWLTWRQLTAAAAAAGIVVGTLCTSMVFAYVAPSMGRAVTLLQESFESGPTPLATGVPVEPGRWSGDYSEVVGADQRVKPESGNRMLRILRADYEGKPESEGSFVGDISRLIDVRPYRAEFADGGAVVQFSAGFNAFAFPDGETYECKLSVHAYDAETATNGSLRIGNTRIASELAGASTARIKLDRDPATWQRTTGDLRLPADADFLLIRIAIQHPPLAPSKATFAGHYLDEVRLTLRRSPLP